jgi:hypothetical protein
MFLKHLNVLIVLGARRGAENKGFQDRKATKTV